MESNSRFDGAPQSSPGPLSGSPSPLPRDLSVVFTQGEFDTATPTAASGAASSRRGDTDEHDEQLDDDLDISTDTDDDHDDVDDDDDDGDDDELSFVAVVSSVDGRWIVREADEFPETIDEATRLVSARRTEGPSFALICVEDQYFVIVRPSPGRTKVLLSDATMAAEDDFAADAMDEIGAEIPLLSEDELEQVDPWAEGDMDILSDLGVGEQVMAVICDDSELWASEQLLRIAAELGCDTELTETLGLDDSD